MSPRRQARGAAVVELALVLPLLVLFLLFGQYLTELLLVKLRLQEVSRYAAWTLTAVPLADLKNGNPEAAFTRARREVTEETRERYSDLDSAEETGARGFAARFSEVRVELSDAEAAVGASLPTAWHFDARGRITASASARVKGVWLPRGLLGELGVRARTTVLADAWTLPDGADAVVAGGRAGRHADGETPSGLYLQVQRMRFFGAGDLLDRAEAATGGVRSVLPLSLPSFGGTFVVSRNYGPGAQCPGIPGYPAGARGGLSNLEALSDHDRPVCFDTAPFRDTQRYRDSLSPRQFEVRGRYFLGCQHPQADDPGAPRDRQQGDRFLHKVDCEEGQ